MSDHLPLVTDLLTDIFLESVFNPEDLERERQVILQEIKMVEDTPDEMIHILFSKNLWPGDPVGRPVMGNFETVSAVGREQIKAYLERNYLPHRILIAAAGDLSHEALVDLMGPAFESLPTQNTRNNLPEPESATGIKLTSKDLEQLHLCLGTRFPNILSEKRFAAAVLNVILGGNMSSRLFQEIREKRGLAYAVYSFFTAYLDIGQFGVYAGVDPEHTIETTRLIMIELDKIRKGEIEAGELRASKEHLKGSIILGSESVDNRMTRLAKNEFTYSRYIDFDEVLDKVESVTLDQVVDLARTYLQPEDLCLSLLGPLAENDLPDHLLS
jgi:predicted Zn-dependent peptidase